MILDKFDSVNILNNFLLILKGKIEVNVSKLALEKTSTRTISTTKLVRRKIKSSFVIVVDIDYWLS